MKKSSLLFKITIWFSVAVIIISGAAVFVTVAIGKSVLERTIREGLVETVENNLDEVEFYKEYDKLEFDDPYDLYIEYKHGYLEIDDDFVRSVNGISTALYDESSLIYGDGSFFPDNRRPAFKNRAVSKVKTDLGTYYIYDIKLEIKELGSPLWMRGTVSAETSISQINTISKAVLMLIPLFVAFAIVGGYIIAKRALSPMFGIKKAAEEIENGNDLSKRIELQNSSDEIQSLADSFNGMFARLEDSFKKEQQLTNDISHELRTPVSVIGAQCQLSLEGESSKEELKEALELIQRQDKKMTRVINDMLQFARIERGAAEIQKEKLNLSDCVCSICEDMSLLSEKGICLSFEIEPEIFVNGNFELLTRMTINLISNAYRYGKENGKIEVRLKKENERAVLSVTDDGIGIKEEELGKIWNRFYRSDASRSSEGTGLGLSFVKEIAEIHGAKAEVQSELGKGSTFTVTFGNLISP